MANVKKITIRIPSEVILKKVNSTPALKDLTRAALKVGDNVERVNHYQYSQILRMLPMAGCEVFDEKDARVVYNNHPIKVDGNVINFDGKGNRLTKILKVYRLHGDVRLFDQALQEFCIDNDYGTAIRI